MDELKGVIMDVQASFCTSHAKYNDGDEEVAVGLLGYGDLIRVPIPAWANTFYVGSMLKEYVVDLLGDLL